MDQPDLLHDLVVATDGTTARKLLDSNRTIARDDYGMDTAQLVRFMCDGVAKRLGTHEFDDALKALQDEHGMDTAQLVSFMIGGVAARLGAR